MAKRLAMCRTAFYTGGALVKGGGDVNERRKWSIKTRHTRNIGARLPITMYLRLKAYADQTGMTMTEIVQMGLDQVLPQTKQRGGAGNV